MVKSNMLKGSFIHPLWNAPSNVVAYTSCRTGGNSCPPFESFNVAQHVGDNVEVVNFNRSLLPNFENIGWLQQTHSACAVELPLSQTTILPEADASFSRQKNVVCAVMTADCLPLLVCDRAGTVVSAIHAGWRGLADGIIEDTIKNMDVEPHNLMVWLGPAISQAHFEVGEEVRQTFADYSAAFVSSSNSTKQNLKFMADLYFIARQKLANLGVEQITGGDYCTYQQNSVFFSHRRASHEGMKTTGRMVSAIYLSHQ